jgi:hypothetical protein
MYIDTTLGHTIESVVKDDSGEITAYKIENGDTIMKEQAVIMAKQGAIKGVSVAVSKKGQEFLKSLPDDDRGNYLDNLPINGEDNNY